MARQGIAYLDPGAAAELRVLESALKVADKEVSRELRRRVYSEIEVPLAARARAAANGQFGRAAATTVKATRAGKFGSIWLGRGSGLGAAVAMGSEWGGRKSRKVRYITLSRTRQTRYIVSRRTTMQFRPHLGTTGYWMAPTLRRHGRETVRKTIEMVMDVLRDLPGARETR